ncbi:MAG: transglycosylase SLT domain-containing protein [Gemmatimonadota bacterium]
MRHRTTGCEGEWRVLVRRLAPVARPAPPRHLGRALVVLAWTAVAAGCGPSVGPGPLHPDPAPRASVLPALPVTAPDVDLPEPSVEVVIDPVRTTPMLRDPAFRGEVDLWIDRWSADSSPWFAGDLERMGGYVPEVDSLLAARGMPPSLRYLPIVESGYSPTAVSSARAVGLWQLMEGTARGLGVRVSRLLDERRHPTRSTEAALRYLDELHADFGSWFLALAAYNSGPARVRRVIARHAPLEPLSDDLYWRIRPHLPRETRDFVPKLFAAILVAEHPEAFGHPPTPARASGFDEVEVPDATSLDVVARAAGVEPEVVTGLNPHVLRGFTPPEARVTLRLPAGTGARFEEAYALIPPEERVTFMEHRVADGETLSHIAVRYGIRVADLREANPSVRPRYLRVGTVLTVPVAPGA